MLKVGFIGLGFISHEHVLGYVDSADAAIVAVCEPDRERAKAWRQKCDLPRARWYAHLDEMLRAESLDIVEVLTPHYLHRDHVLQCAAAKVKGISVQKPMAVGLRQCDQMIEACDEHGVVLRLYENYIFYPVYEKAKALIAAGIIGDLRSIRIHTIAGIRAGAAWPPFWDKRSALLDVAKCQNSPLVGDDGLHKFQLACWFTQRPIEKISAWIEPDTPMDAPACIRAKFQGNSGEPSKYAQLDFTFLPNLAIPCDLWLDDFVEICGEKGIMWINQCAGGGDRELFRGNQMSQSRVFPPIAVFVDGKVTTHLDEMSARQRNWSTSFVVCTRHFVDVIANRGRPVCTGEEGKNLNRYGIAALLAAQERRDVDLNEVTTEAESAGHLRLKTNFCNVEAMP